MPHVQTFLLSLWRNEGIIRKTFSFNYNQDFKLIFHILQLDFRNPAGFDRTRNAVIGKKNIDLTYLEEAYTSEHWLVRIYRLERLTQVFLVILSH